MDIIILAGGLGTRLRGVVPHVPKTLAPVNGRPFLDTLLESLERSGEVSKVVITTSYLADAIHERYTDARYRFPLVFSREESPLGTGGAVKKALTLTSGDDVIIMNGDTYADADLSALIRFHKEKNSAATIVVAKKDNAARYGGVALDDDFKIYSFVEKKGGADFVSAGTLILKRHLFDSVPEGVVCSLEMDLIPQWLPEGMYAYVHHGGFIDIGTPESYAQAENYLTARKRD